MICLPFTDAMHIGNYKNVLYIYIKYRDKKKKKKCRKSCKNEWT